MHAKCLDLLMLQVGPDRPLGKIAVRDLEQFRARRLSTGLSAWSANREIKTLKRLFNLAIERNYLPQGHNPCDGLSLIKVTPKLPAYCGSEDFRLLYQQTHDPLWQAMLVTIYTTGLRLREVMNLTWIDVDFAKSQLRVIRKDDEGFIQAWQPKDHEIRTIPLPEQTVTLLANWQSVAPENCPYVFMEHGRWVYYHQQLSSRQWRVGQDLVNNMLRRFKTLCRRAGVGPYTIHDLRRSCITNWAKALPIHVVQKLAGHSDIKTTQMYYLSIQAEDIKKAQRIQSKVLGKIVTETSTDQKLTNSGKKRVFLGRKVWEDSANDCKNVSYNRVQEDSNL